MIIFNATNDPQATAIISLNGTLINVRTTYIEGINNHWVLDIYDADNNPMLLGICVTVGADLLKGQGGLFAGIHLYAALTSSSEDERDKYALGNTLYLLVYFEGEELPIKYKDRFNVQNWED